MWYDWLWPWNNRGGFFDLTDGLGCLGTILLILFGVACAVAAFYYLWPVLLAALLISIIGAIIISCSNGAEWAALWGVLCGLGTAAACFFLVLAQFEGEGADYYCCIGGTVVSGIVIGVLSNAIARF